MLFFSYQITLKTYVLKLYTLTNRWQEELNTLRQNEKTHIGSCLLTAAFLSYAGPFNLEFRLKMMYDNLLKDIINRNIPIIESYVIHQQLVNEVHIRR